MESYSKYESHLNLIEAESSLADFQDVNKLEEILSDIGKIKNAKERYSYAGGNELIYGGCVFIDDFSDDNEGLSKMEIKYDVNKIIDKGNIRSTYIKISMLDVQKGTFSPIGYRKNIKIMKNNAVVEFAKMHIETVAWTANEEYETIARYAVWFDPIFGGMDINDRDLSKTDIESIIQDLVQFSGQTSQEDRSSL